MQRGFTPILIVLFIISYFPTIALLTGYMGITLFFPSYFIASTFYIILAFLFLQKVKINLPLPLLLLLIITKSVIVQIVLLYLFTPTFDFIALVISAEKFCSPTNIDFITRHGKADQITQGCAKILQILGR